MPLAEGLWPEPRGIRPVYSLKRFTCEQRLNQRPVGPLVKPLLDQKNILLWIEVISGEKE